MNPLQVLWALVAIVGVQAVTDIAVVTLGRREAAMSHWLPYLVSGAAGVLLATACLDLLPEAVHASGSGLGVWEILLGSLLALFCLQAAAHWLTDQAVLGPAETASTKEVHRHVHGPIHDHGRRPSANRVSFLPLLFGSALHSGIDGVAIMAAFLGSRRAGWSAALAVGLHELPHRMGDFALLAHMGLPRRRAAQFAIGAGAMAIVGGLAVALLGEHHASVPWLLPISAATFLYIALVDLVPELQANHRGHGLWWQILCLGAGAALMTLLVHLPGE